MSVGDDRIVLPHGSNFGPVTARSMQGDAENG